MSERNRTPLFMLVIWLLTTLAWWGLAFAPTPSIAPEWLLQARSVCFGSLDNGLPDTSGWLLLILGPLSFLIALFVVWREDLTAELKRIMSNGLGRVALVASLALIVTEATWVGQKLQSGWSMEKFDAQSQSLDDFPSHYTRTSFEAPEFELIDQAGERISPKKLEGRIILLTFAFAHCQTVCPLLVKQSLTALSEINRSDVSLLIITLDPWRDTPSSLPTLAEKWGLPKNAHILSGTVQAVTKALDQYNIPWKRDEKTGDIAHPALTYVIGKDGKIAYTFNDAPSTWLTQSVVRLGGLAKN